MNEWHTTVLKNCISIIETGKREKGGAVSVGIPSIGAEHLQKDGHINWAESSMKYVSAVFFESMKTGKLQPDDVLLVKDGATTGKVAYVDTVPAQGAAINEHIFLMRPKEDLLPKYLYFYLYSPIGKNNVLRFFKGAAIGGISRDFLNAEIKMPPISMQKDIVEKLSYIDESIDVCQAILDKTEELVKSRFIEMFGDLAFNPMNWDEVPLVETCADNDDIKCGPFGTQLGKHEYIREGVPLWGIPQINAAFAIPPTDFLSAEKAEQLSSYSLLPGDIAMSRKGNVGKCAIYPEGSPKGIIHSDVLRIRVDTEVCNPVFLMCQLHFSRAIGTQIDTVSSGAIMAGINVTKLKKIMVYVPPIALQNQFADFVALADKSEYGELLNRQFSLKNAMFADFYHTKA